MPQLQPPPSVPPAVRRAAGIAAATLARTGRSVFARVPGLAAASLLLAVGVGACAVPDRPPRLGRELPAEVRAYLGAEAERRVRLADGVWYRYVWTPRGPWAVHLVEARLDRCELGLDVVRAGRDDGHGRVSEMVGPPGSSAPLAAVNGDFFTPEGRPLGPELVEGRLRTARSRPVLAWRPGGAPWIGPARAGSGGTVEVAGWSSDSAGPDDVLVGGYPELLDRGGRVDDLLVQENPGFAASRHPRTAVGFEPDGGTLWLVVVDGRQGEYSSGMTLPELAGLFEALGVPEALNLDGGGSSVMVLRGRVVSRPSDESGERAVVNALVLRRDVGFCAR